MTAISNDISYDDVYSFQLDALGQEGDVLVAISSSGNSPNVVKAIETAKSLKMKTIALTGFDGGKARELADISLHVDINEYEAAEDVHQAIMHMIAKYMRTKNSG
jgi:phosphoheptose isomerase